MIGKTVGKYRIVDRLGRGGMGTVYKAVDETLDREVAIKVLNPDLGDTDVLKRFRAEAVTLARLNHPGIATLYELHRHEDDLLMVMEFVRGETFHDLSDRLGPIAPPQAAHLCMQVLDALAHAHRAGVVHRDLKPANLMVSEAGTVKVMDFGIARVLGAEHFTYGGYMMGTPAFMAPEQVLGREVDGRSDLYAIGVVFYRLLSGQLPFDADTAIAIVQKQVSEPPTPISTFCPDLPRWCTEVIERALAKAPGDRFQSAEEFRSALITAVQPQTLGELPTMATPTPPGLPRDWETASAHEVTRAAALTVGRSLAHSGAGTAVATPPSQAVVTASATGAGQAAASAAGRKSRHTTTTVILGRTHLFALAALLLVLAGGIAVLGVAAFKRGGFAEQIPLLGTLPQAEAVEPSPASGEPAQGDPQPGGAAMSGPPAAGPAANPGVAATAGAGAAQPAPISTTPRAPPRPAPPPTPAPSAETAAKRDVVPAAPATVVDPLPAVSFDDVRVLVADADNRGRERQARLRLGDGLLTLVDRDGGESIVSLKYADVRDAFYSRSRQPKWRDADGKDVESKVDLGRLGFFRGERNWLILLTAGEPLIFRVEDSSLQRVLPAVQERTGVQIKR